MGNTYRSLKIILICGAIFLALIFGGVLYLTANKLVELSSPTFVTIHGATVEVGIAATPALRRRGLGGREHLSLNEGMLFIFEKPENQSFWMKDMKIPIDIIWIRENVVVGIAKNLLPPQPGAVDSDLALYPPPLPVDRVLEVAAGFSEKFGISIGDGIEIGNKR